MWKSSFKILFFGITLICHSQVGINTTNPEAILDIQVSDHSNPENTDGILIPRVSKFPDTNPTPAKNGILVYLTTAVDNHTPGLYYWCAIQSKWCKFMTEVNVMLATKLGTILDLTGDIFNFPDLLFSNIPGASFNSNELSLPVGIYEIESNLKLSNGVSLEWNLRLNGTVHPGSIAGSSNLGLLGLFTSSTPQRAIVVITSASDVIDFIITAGFSASLLPKSSYLMIKKIG